MNLEHNLTVAIRHLRGGALNDEAQVKQSVILPILRALGWNTDAPEELQAEFHVGPRRVDYALLDYDQPLVFIEAKAIGKADRSAQEQLFEYARNEGVPILVLTDGMQWEFYFGTGPGAWEERCFRRLKLDDDQKVSTNAEFLAAHLGREAVVSGAALNSATRMLRETRAFERARRKLPDVWRALLAEAHPELRKLLGEKVEKETKVMPRPEDIESFLKKAAIGFGRTHSLGSTAAVDTSDSSKPIPASRRDVSRAYPESDGKGHGRAERMLGAEGHSNAAKSRIGGGVPGRDFERPILNVLIEMGGVGHRKKVLFEVGQLMATRLGDDDKKPVKGERGRLRWERTAEYRVSDMRKKRWLKQVSETEKGVWEITDLGRAGWAR